MEGIVLSLVSIISGLAGMLFHFWKKKIKKQTFDSLKEYIKGNPIYTIMATTVTVGGTIGLASTAGSVPLGDFSVLSAYIASCAGIGFICDSLINKTVTDSSSGIPNG